MAGTTAQDSIWKSKGQAEEARHAREKGEAQLATIRARLEKDGKNNTGTSTGTGSAVAEHDFEGGFGGQEDLEDRYATTSGEH
ncbi:hypothetical protein PAXINDRAFT_10106 [Paxillus involutus ATCC 200175]|nr:hypothetical protein PAXINDRAFT_10106 [Paxillus involutus ATCC 200175]